MFQPVEPQKRQQIAHLFANHRPSFLIDAVLEGHLGTAVINDSDEPSVAKLAYADVVTYGGDAEHLAAQSFAEQLPIDKGILPIPAKWNDLLRRVHGDHLIAIERYPFSGESLEIGYLQSLTKTLPTGFQLKQIDLQLARQIDANGDLISEDHVQNFNSPEHFVEKGVGFCILDGDRIVSGASSYAFCNKGIEVQVNTHPEYRGKRLATIVSAALLVHCLQNNIEAHWDAGNPTSVKLATRLGYTAKETYEMFVRVE